MGVVSGWPYDWHSPVSSLQSAASGQGCRGCVVEAVRRLKLLADVRDDALAAFLMEVQRGAAAGANGAVAIEDRLHVLIVDPFQGAAALLRRVGELRRRHDGQRQIDSPGLRGFFAFGA